MPRRYRRRRTGGLSDVVLGVLQRPTSGMYRRRRRRRTTRRTGGLSSFAGIAQTPTIVAVTPGKPSGYYNNKSKYNTNSFKSLIGTTSGMYRRRRRRTTRRRRTGGGLGTGLIKTNVASMLKGPMLSLNK